MRNRLAAESHADRLAREYRVSEAWSRSRLPALHRRRLDAPLAWPGDVAARLWASLSRGGMAVLTGERGTGKTQLAVLMAQGFIEELGRGVMYWRADDLFDHLRGLFGRPTHEQAEERANLVRVGLLILDELQDRGDTDFEDRELRRLLDKRYANSAATVLISNLRADEFARRVGPSVVSRLNEVGLIVTCDWASFREAAQ